MVWAAFSARGKSEIGFFPGKINSTVYCDVLAEYMLPFAEAFYSREWTFQQYNAACHTSEATNTWFMDKIVTAMARLAQSPDLYPIENLWGLLVQKVYQGCCQRDTKEYLMGINV